MTPRVNKLLTSGYNWALALTRQILNHDQSEYGTELVYRSGKWFGCFPQYRETVPTGTSPESSKK
ncbi:hypothetical protein NWP21_03475 [Anabaenopsis sp. FSS-46]|uniref:hypothetical protein n=1 Tax=Anabaenopsis sp. FSS-46 TaxID=2971766 RepID=UPI002477166C|nr:hypothetical protein [Anabaenopsis sp. FSS-46]MDH6097920.1 hypothetical protein [Anabaenopsis sp. FSS-46]